MNGVSAMALLATIRQMATNAAETAREMEGDPFSEGFCAGVESVARAAEEFCAWATIRRENDAVELMVENEDGWSDWIHPLPGYRMQCCDCGLIHEMEFAIGQTINKGGPFNDGEDEASVVVFRARRSPPSPAEHPASSRGEAAAGTLPPDEHPSPTDPRREQ